MKNKSYRKPMTFVCLDLQRGQNTPVGIKCNRYKEVLFPRFAFRRVLVLTLKTVSQFVGIWSGLRIWGEGPKWDAGHLNVVRSIDRVRGQKRYRNVAAGWQFADRQFP